MISLPYIALYSASVLSLLVGVTVLARDYKKLENIAFFGLSFGIVCWSIGIAGFSATGNVGTALIWAKFYYFAPLLIVFFSVLFAQNFMYRRPLDYRVNGVIGVSGIVLAVLLLSQPTFITGHIITHAYGKQVVLNAGQYVWYGLYLLVCFGFTIGLTFQKSRRASTKISKQQINIFLGGFVASCLSGLLFNLLLPGFGNYALIAIGPVSTTFLMLTVAYAIVRHKLFDVRLVVARTLGYASSLLLLSLLYGFVVFGVSRVAFGLKFSIATQIYLSLATAFAGLLFGRFKASFDKATNHIFYRDAYDPQELFDSLNKVLVSTVEINKLLRLTSLSIAENLKAQYCAIGLREIGGQNLRIFGTQTMAVNAGDIAFARKVTPHFHQIVIAVDSLGDEHRELKEVLTRNNIAVLVRLSSNVKKNEEGLGYIVLGAKKSGNAYTTQDYKVLDTIAKELIIAIQNALRVEEIENFNINLQARVDAATRKLRRTNEKLKELDEAKDDFVSMASHQLRTPLTSIKGYTSMVLEGDAGKINDTQRKLLEQSFFSSQRMVYLIADLLNVSRLKTGKFIIEPIPVNLAEVVEQEIVQLKETAAGRSLTLDYKMPKNFPVLMLDETKTRQVIMNFVDNAIYYTPAGGHIDVKLIETPASVELRVTDNGIGVPKSEQPHLFTKFYRAGNARKARPDGTGLGLFMAKKVIVAEGGAVIFETEEGKGSTFGFVFSKSKLAPSSSVKDPIKVAA